ncbi:GntR family transcriptional regulator [Caldicellulosiruptoraceae bacterium PP1]
MDTKYKIIIDFIKESIQSGKFKEGQPIYSENMLAKKFNASRHTVRRAIMELTFEGVLVSIKGKGTFVANGYNDTARYIAVLTTYISDYIFPSIIRGIEKIMTKEGFGLILLSTDNNYEIEKYHLNNILQNDKIIGVIIEPTKSAFKSPNSMIYNALDQKGIPTIFINTILESISKNYIITNDTVAVFKLVDKLCKLHSNLLGIFKKDDLQGLKRYEGFKNACEKNNVAYDILWFETDEYSTIQFEALKKVNKEKFDCIVCYNDKIALSMCITLKEKGYKIPQDISVAGFDNSFLSTLSEIKLTSINHPKEKLGELAAKMIINMIRGKINEVKQEIDCEIIFRNSTKI